MKLNLGAGNLIMKGFVNHDLTIHRPEIDIAFDLNQKDWYKSFLYLIKVGSDGLASSCDNAYTEIRAYDVIEHLDDPINFMNSCWELLDGNGILNLKACGYKNESYWIDITHKRAFHLSSFDYFDPTTELGKEYGYYTNKKWKILDKHYDRKGNVIVQMMPIKTSL